MKLAHYVRLVGLGMAFFGLLSCSREEAPRIRFEKVAAAELPGWADDQQVQALSAFQRSCVALLRRPDDRKIGLADYAGTVADWRRVCEQAVALDESRPEAARDFFAQAFEAYKVIDGDTPKGLFTGYYEALLNGSRQPDATFTTPLYQLPADLVAVDLGAFDDSLKGRRIAGRVEDGRLLPYDDRASIQANGLEGRAQPLLWVDDPIEAFFMEIQGSGQISLRDGSRIRIGYAGQNGRPYRAIGRDLVAMGAIPAGGVSLEAIRGWLRSHPDQAQAVMAKNPSYVFFREMGPVNDELGPVGAQGVPLAPGRSLAVDRRHVAYGMPVWLDTSVTLPEGSQPLRRLMVAQDTGGAIRGPIRGDVFWGVGTRAEYIAGHMKDEGTWYLLLPKTLPAPGSSAAEGAGSAGS